MPYSDPQLEARLKTKIAGTANKQQPVISQPTRSGGFSDPQLEARLKGISSGGQRTSLPPLTPIKPIKTEQPKQGLLKGAIDFAGKFTGISTGEVGGLLNNAGGLLSKANDFGVVHKNISPTDVISLGKRALDGIKGIIGAESEKYAKKEQQYKIDQSIPDYQALDFDQTIDLNSVGMLKLAKGDIQVDYDELNAKESKTKLDQYRLNNMKATLDEINKNLELSPDKRKKNEVFITGLALSRISGNLASGFLGSLKGVADFVKWRGDVAESESVSKFSETTAKHLNQWAEAVAPDNPQLADEILQGAGSTLAFYLPGAGVSSLTAKLATVSPKLATLFGVTASATLEAATESGNTYVEMVDSGASRKDADLAASRVFAGNIIFNIVSDKVGLFSDAEGIKKILTTSLAEGSQEAFQDGLQATAQNKDIDGKAIAKTFFIGAVVGGGMGSVIQNASISDDLNKDDKEKLAELADKIRQVEAGADPEMLGFNFVDTTAGFEVASSGIQLTDKGVYAELNNQQLEYLKDEVAKLGFTATDKPHLTPIDKLRNSEMKLVTLDEIKDLSPNVAKAFEGLQTTKKKTDQFDYGSTQLDLTGQVAEDVTEFAKSLPESDVYKDPNANYDAQRTGRESEPHITVLFGLDTTNQAEVEGLVQSVEPIEVELGEVSQFDTNENYDVIKVDVISDELAALNSKLDKVLETPGKTFDEYQPHVTIAYVKKGTGQKYVGDTRFKGQKITLDNLTFSSKDGKRVNIPLLGKQAENKVSDKVDQVKNQDKSIREVPANQVETGLPKEFAAKLNRNTPKIKELEAAIKRGDDVPAIPVYEKDGKFFTNSDGDNRLIAYQNVGTKTIPVEVQEKTTLAPDQKQKVERAKVEKARSRLIQFPSVYAGLSSKGSEKIHNFELRKPPKPSTEEFKLHKKVTELIRKYAQTIGEGYTPRNALGVYFPKTKNIRVNSINNVTVAAHEIAHFLDAANGITDKILTTGDSNIQEQIKKIYLQYYPTARENHQKRLQTLEGFAVLLQKYTEQPTTINNEYPDLVKEFLQKGGTYYHPVIGEILTDLNQMIGEYQGLEALDKIGARVTSENTNINKPSFLNFWQKLRTEIADEVYPVEVLAQKGKVSFTKEDPSLWVRAYNAVSGIINNNISTDRGYWSFTDLQNGWQKKYDYNWKSLIESTQRRNVLDSFSHYLVARREWYLYQELDQLKAARDQVEMIAKAFETVKADEMAEFDRDLRASLSEDYGVDLTEMEYEKAKAAIKKLFEQTDKAHQEQKEILDNDAFSREEIETAYIENKERFKDEETMFDALTREDLDLMHNPEVQLLDDKSYNQLKSREGYASFKRQFYDEIVGDLDAPGAIRVGKTKVSSLIGRTGSERTIINPLFSALANHSEIIRKSMKQVVYNQVGKLGTSALMPKLMQVVPIKTTVDKNTGAISFPQEKDNNIIMARQGYKRVPVLIDSEIKTIIDMVLSHKNIDTFTQLYTGLSRMFTAGTTGLYPQFALTNFVIDQITATANSYNKYKGLYSPMKDMLTVLRKKNSVEAKYYEEYLVMGGERQTFTGWQRLEPKDLFKRISNEKTKMQKAIDSLQKGIDILSIPSAKSEIFSRATEYINARKSGKSQIVSLEEAGRVTAPFHHIGAWGAKEGQRSFGQTFIRGLPFFNASIQVLDQTARVANTKEGRKRMTFVTLAVMAAYLSSIMAMMGGNDEQKEQYKDLEAEDLSNFIYFPNPNGKGLLRLKMANTFSVPGTIINMIIANKMFSAKYEAKDAMEAATSFLPDQFNVTDPTKAILGWIPQLFKPITHVIFNVKEYPTVTSLVSQGLQRKPAALQYNEGTSVFAKKLGELLDLSPIKIDYLLTGYLGRASGFLTGKPGVYNLASSVMRDYYFTSGRRVREFYDTKEKTDGEYTAYQNLEKGFEDLPKDRVDEIYRVNIITTNIDELLGEYRDLDVEVDQEKAAELRAEILVHIENLENGTKPKNFGKWSMDAKKRRQKNKLDKK